MSKIFTQRSAFLSFALLAAMAFATIGISAPVPPPPRNPQSSELAEKGQFRPFVPNRSFQVERSAPADSHSPIHSIAPSNQVVSPRTLMPQEAAGLQDGFLYPDPRTIQVPSKRTTGKAANQIPADRYARISELERELRMLQEVCDCAKESGKCPLCVDDPKTPCGECKMCKAGFPCEKVLCRHCVQPRSSNMCNSCDLAGGDEPCGTCDACREHRSDPCEHADDGHGPRGEFNPYNEPRLFSTLPRPVVDLFNDGARKFPIYYNPAPYYRPTWNPSTFVGYARPYTFRWSCPLCYKNPCQCDKPGFAGQVPFAYSCKFCNRNPCACAEDICDVTKPMEPRGRSKAITEMRGESSAVSSRANRSSQEVSPQTSSREERSPGSALRDEDESIPSQLRNQDAIQDAPNSTNPSTTPADTPRRERRRPLVPLDSPPDTSGASPVSETGTIN
ncbi:MAG: hypothetical protein ACRCUY_01790 [Thermoguttaceae bacterium]